VRPPCGTPAGQQAHLRHHEPACLSCADAKADYVRSRAILAGSRNAVLVSPAVLGLLLRSHPDALRQAIAELGARTVQAAKLVSVRAQDEAAQEEAMAVPT
jgi:hypothetical protein